MLTETSIEDLIQIAMTIVAIVLGFLLALLQWAGAYSLDAFLDKSQEEDKSKAKKMMSRAHSHGSTARSEFVDNKGKKVKL